MTIIDNYIFFSYTQYDKNEDGELELSEFISMFGELVAVSQKSPIHPQNIRIYQSKEAYKSAKYPNLSVRLGNLLP